ncbi:glycosyl transferase [Paramecium bursaria Chlorella virus OR0704.2.2]|nr:glycosyl transferase [Paramecium bursaria Chlorella virus OR0704.2.2]
MRVIGFTFATDSFAGSAAALKHSALTTGEFSEFHVYSPKDIEWLMDTFPGHFADGNRGFGWWAWKSFLIRNVMAKTEDGAVLVYIDSAAVFERSIRPYVDFVTNNKPILLQRLGNWSAKENDYRVKKWTKKSILNHIGGPKAGDSIMLEASFQVYRNCPESRAFVQQYMNFCLDLDMVNDSGKDSDVIDCRHDQSILSVLAFDHPKIAICRNASQWGKLDPSVEDVIEIDSKGPDGVMYNLFEHHRRQLRLPKIAVITPTTGGKFLEACIESVQKSTLPNIEHWVVVDGKEHEAKVDLVLSKFEGKHTVVKFVLPKNVGAGGWNGHRVYGSLPFLVTSDYVAYLDDDNVVAPTQYADLLRGLISNKSKWSYCLRYLMDADGNRVGEDNCESLGGISHAVYGPGNYLIDTSCYMLDRDLAIMAGPIWNARFRDPTGKPEPDRELCKVLLQSAPHTVIRKHHLGYRLGSTGLSVKPEFFSQGNQNFGYDFEKFQDIYIFHFNKKATDDFLMARKMYSRQSFALHEWQMTLLRGLDGLNGGKYNLLNGFTNAPNIPEESTVLVSLCNPGELPLEFLKERKDLNRIVYTLESPNIRHTGQWSIPKFLQEYFDVALTYFTPLLTSDFPTVYTPHNCHHGTLDDPLDRAILLRNNKGFGRSVGLVLERRPELFNHKEYSVIGCQLKCLDYLREDLVKGQKDITVFGMNWSEVADGVNIKLGHGNHRSRDDKSSVDHKQNFVFDLVIENCDAPGYVSEKFYDALSAGCIPLYYGNVFDKLSGLIPEGPDGAFFDLKKRGIDTGAKLQELIDSLSDEQISGMRQNVAKYREAVLEFAGTKAFANAVDEAIVLSTTL